MISFARINHIWHFHTQHAQTNLTLPPLWNVDTTGKSVWQYRRFPPEPWAAVLGGRASDNIIRHRLAGLGNRKDLLVYLYHTSLCSLNNDAFCHNSFVSFLTLYLGIGEGKCIFSHFNVDLSELYFIISWVYSSNLTATLTVCHSSQFATFHSLTFFTVIQSLFCVCNK